MSKHSWTADRRWLEILASMSAATPAEHDLFEAVAQRGRQVGAAKLFMNRGELVLRMRFSVPAVEQLSQEEHGGVVHDVRFGLKSRPKAVKESAAPPEAPPAESEAT